MPKRHPAFTLIELLVVIVIIAILVAMLLPGLQLAKEKAVTLQCMSTQRMIGLATQSYTTDGDGYLPAANPTGTLERHNWYNAVDPYLLGEETPVTDSDDRRHEGLKQDPVWTSFSAAKKAVNRTIKMNENLEYDDAVNNIVWRISRIVPPLSQLVLYTDGRAWDITGPNNSTSMNSRFSNTAGVVALRHGRYVQDVNGSEARGAIVIFMDGHAAMHHDLVNSALTYPGWNTNPTPGDAWKNKLEWYPWEKIH